MLTHIKIECTQFMIEKRMNFNYLENIREIHKFLIAYEVFNF